MASDDPFEKKLGIILKEWDHIQFHIGRFDTIIFNIRQWCITMFTAFLGASIALHRPSAVLLAVMPVTLLWMLDALHKSFQRRFTDRGREIERYLSSTAFDGALADRSLTGFAAPRMSLGFGEGTIAERGRQVLNAARIRNVATTYLSILGCCLLAYFVLRLD